jgi:hypothetical protein
MGCSLIALILVGIAGKTVYVFLQGPKWLRVAMASALALPTILIAVRFWLRRFRYSWQIQFVSQDTWLNLRAVVITRKELEGLSYEEAMALPDDTGIEVATQRRSIGVEYNVLEREPDYVHIGISGEGMCPVSTSIIIEKRGSLGADYHAQKVEKEC